MLKKITLAEWKQVEYALMKSGISYKVSFDIHRCMDGTVYDKMICIESFAVTHFEEDEESDDYNNA